MIYNGGDSANPSSIDKASTGQIRQDYYDRKAIIDIKDEMLFAQLSGTQNMPKNYGKEIVKHRYIPLLDDENVNSQGLDPNDNTIANGNLYGSSRDVGTINSKLPDLRETGGRINRVGFTRKEVRANIVNRGFFFEWTKDSMNFDTDADLKMHVTREAVRGAAQINEDVLAIELINGAGVNYFAGAATTIATITGESAESDKSVPTYADLINLDIELDNNKCPKDTRVIVGSRLTDTKTVQGGRFMFISADVKASFMAMEDLHGNPAFIDVKHYQDANREGRYIKSIHGEIGSVGPFRLVVHPKMVVREGAGLAVTTNGGFRATSNRYDVYPCLIVGSEAFTHIGFETGAGTKGKFKTRTQMPEQAGGTNDPFFKTGFTSIEFWNGVLIDRPEWLAVYNIAGKLY
jgi:N4-gp56 family major capsid protein